MLVLALVCELHFARIVLLQDGGHWLWGHELLTFQGEATETYTKWAALAGPFFRVKGALFHPDIVSG